MICLAFDIGEHIGWVKGAAVGPLEHGTFDVPEHKRLGPWLRAADDFWRDVMPGADVIAYEQPFFGKDIYAADRLFGMKAMIHYWAGWIVPSVPVKPVMIATAKATLAGNRWATKERMVAAAAERGYEGLDEHQADALGVWWAIVFGKAPAPQTRRSRSGPGRVVTP